MVQVIGERLEPINLLKVRDRPRFPDKSLSTEQPFSIINRASSVLSLTSQSSLSFHLRMRRQGCRRTVLRACAAFYCEIEA